jgi:hypothetical protein
MKIKTTELVYQALGWAVAQAEGLRVDIRDGFVGMMNARHDYDPGTFNWYQPWKNWQQGGPIIALEKIGTWPSEADKHENQWGARMLNTYIMYGPTPLIAAMRCYVASKLGDEVEIPEELT